MLEIITESLRETKKVAAMLASEVMSAQRRHAYVIALSGNLGAGKTTFVQGFAEALGIKDNVLSPTFVLMKLYALPQQRVGPASRRHLVHIDCYRLHNSRDLTHLGFEALLQDRNAIIMLEWAERVSKILPKSTLWIYFKHRKNPDERIITLD